MNTRWSTLLAALCLTVMALGGGRAAHAASVTGAGIVVTVDGDVLRFNVSARSGRGGIVVVRFGGDEFVCAVTGLGFNYGSSFANASVSAVVTDSTNPSFPVGAGVQFGFTDWFTGSDGFGLNGLGFDDFGDYITRGFITIRG
jgi:hypothetical protein